MTKILNRLNETALVTKQEGPLVWVATQSKLACSSCKVASSCGTGIIENYFSGKVFETLIENSLEAQVGDLVEISVPKSSLTLASILLYVLPLLGLVIGAVIGDALNLAELSVILLSFLGIALALIVSRFWSKSLLNRGEFQPKLNKVIKKAQPGTSAQSISVSNIDA
jgi:sigma-E factor negative regulatory protein RseC